jgi:hypothetical protein
MAHHVGFTVYMGTMASGADMMSGCGLLDGSRTLRYAHLLLEAEATAS